jgi:plastocyanin
MQRIALSVVVAAAAVLVVTVAAFARGTRASVRAVEVHGTVGPGFTIKLTAAGKKVTRLAPGTYRFVISDRSAAHNFVLERESGARFEKEITSVPFTGDRTATVSLSRGEWKFYCDPHQTTMVGSFSVGNAALPATTTTDDHGRNRGNDG